MLSKVTSQVHGMQPIPDDPLFELYEIHSKHGSGSLIPVFDRSASVLARAFGYQSCAVLAGSLPADARVLDVGAGASTLGLEVCRLNPDVEWINADPCYGKKSVQEQLAARKDLPANLRFVPTDVVDLIEEFGPHSFDKVFTFFMLQHLELSAPDVALQGTKNLLRMPKPKGSLSLGPVKGLRLGRVLRDYRGVDSITLAPSASTREVERAAPQVLERVRLKGVAARMQRRNNGAMLK